MDIYSRPELKHFITLNNFVRDMKVRHMFGSHGIFKSDIMIGIIDANGTFYIRATDNAERFESLNYQQYKYEKRHHSVYMSYYALPESFIEKTSDFIKLIEHTYQKSRNQKSKEAQLRDAPNITVNLEKKLNQIGITTLSELKKTGACSAYLKLREQFKCPYTTLFSLEAAIRGVHVAVLSYADRAQLEQQLVKCA